MLKLAGSSPCCRSALILYRQILDGIEKNGYNNFTQRAYVPKLRKLASLPMALLAAQMPQAMTEAHAQKLLRKQQATQPTASLR